MNALLAVLNSNLVSALAGAAIGFFAARATSGGERRARVRSLARGLSAESRRIREALASIEILEGPSELPRVNAWMVPLVTQGGEISADLVLCFLDLENDLGKAELARAEARGRHFELASREKDKRNWRDWKERAPMPGVIPPALTDVGEEEFAKSRSCAETSARDYAIAKTRVLDQLDAIDRLLSPHLKA